MSENEPLSIALIGMFLVLSAFFSSSEAAFLSLQRTRIAHLVSSGTPGAGRVANMVREPERLLSTILLGNNIVNVAFTALLTVLIVSTLGEDREGQSVLIATGVGTVVLLVAGETIPKTLALRRSERVALLYARPLKGIETLMWPLVVMLQWTTRRVNSIFGGSATRWQITESELRTLIDLGEAEGTFEPEEAEMLENVFRFGDRQVREVMTPRNEFVSIERGATLSQFLEVYGDNSHTRFPVYHESIDNIIGILSAKDILKAISSKGIDLSGSVTEVIRDAYYIPETKRIAELFSELRQSGNQMAIAVDEYGGLAGLVTLKRLSEEVVGPVGEEGEGPEEEYEAIDQNTYHVDGSMSIEEANEELEIKLPEGEFETVAGFALYVLGHIPVQGERFEYRDLSFEITDMNELKIETIKVTKADSPEGGAQVETDSGATRRDPSE